MTNIFAKNGKLYDEKFVINENCMTNSFRKFFFKCGTNYIKAHLMSRAISEQKRKPEKKSFFLEVATSVS